MLFKINDFSYDDTNGLIVKGHEKNQLTKIQKKLFNYFIQNPGVTVSKQTLMTEVWGRVVTENSIEKTISKLRNAIEENPLKPELLITHFGHGISFEGNTVAQEKKVSKKSNSLSRFYQGKKTLLALLLVIIAVVVLIQPWKRDDGVVGFQLPINKNQRIIMLPITFDDIVNKPPEQFAVNDYVKSTFNGLDSEGRVSFDESGNDYTEIVEKNWRIDQDLIVMQTSVKKQGEIYDAVMQFSDGLNQRQEIKFSANNLMDLASRQVSLVAQVHEGINIHGSTATTTDHSNEQLLLALSYKKDNKLQLAKEQLNEIIEHNDQAFQARFVLHEVLFAEAEYKKSLAVLEALKNTGYYANNSANIELGMATNHAALNDRDAVISGLLKYLSQHPIIGPVKHAKTRISLANAYVSKGMNNEAMKFYKQAIIGLDENIHGQYFAESYFGQAKVAHSTSNDKSVYQLFEQALYFAELTNNIRYQAVIKDSMSVILFYGNSWEKGLKLKRESVALMELLGDDDEALATGLGVLASFLIERGLFSEAREVVERIKTIADNLNADLLTLVYNHYDIVLAMNDFQYDYCQREVDKQYKLAQSSNNYGMLLNNGFLQLELLLARKDVLSFESVWEERSKLLQTPGLERYQVFMDLYLARYYKQVAKNEAAIEVILKVSEVAKSMSDFKFFSDAQNNLAEIYLQSDPQKALNILLDLEQHNPNPNPYLELKAKALSALDRKVDALTTLTEAKLSFNEAWKAENQAFLLELQSVVKP